MQPSGDTTAPIAIMIFMIVIYGSIILLSIAAFVFWIVELVDAVRREFKTPTEKLVWVLIICLSHFVGALIYLVVGKKTGWLPGEPPPLAPIPPPTL